jgi:hypothetical protein
MTVADVKRTMSKNKLYRLRDTNGSAVVEFESSVCKYDNLEFVSYITELGEWICGTVKGLDEMLNKNFGRK